MSALSSLDLLFLNSILEDPEVWSHSVLLKEHQEDHAVRIHLRRSENSKSQVYRFSLEELEVVELGKDLVLHKGLHFLLEGSDTIGVGLLQLVHQGLHVPLDVSHISLLIKACLLQSVGIHKSIHYTKQSE